MTYSVPYSFVPGTKAKADEVNANFISVLNDIDETNVKIDTTNTNLELLSDKVDIVESTADDNTDSIVSLEQVVDGKPNHTDIDGQWVMEKYAIAAGTVVAVGTYEYSLADYIPNDGYDYEVCFNLFNYRTSNGASYIKIFTDLMEAPTDDSVLFGMSSASSISSITMFNLPVGAQRQCTMIISDGNQTSVSFINRLTVLGYRRIGKNS